MALTITGRLKKPAREFAANEYTGFSFNLNKKVKIKGEEQWTTYAVAIFSKSQPQIEFYRTNLVENSVVTCSAKDLIIEKREYEGKEYLSIKLVYAELENVFSMGEQSGAPQQQPVQQQQPMQTPPGYQQGQPKGQHQKTAPQPATGRTVPSHSGFDNFDPDVPF